jgi:hypothetical protein
LEDKEEEEEQEKEEKDRFFPLIGCCDDWR